LARVLVHNIAEKAGEVAKQNRGDVGAIIETEMIPAKIERADRYCWSIGHED
jgi:hypothetical protein